MVDAARPEPAPPERPTSAEAASAPGHTAGPAGPPHLADPRALTILTTEHWGQLTARSLVYNETFSRGSMFLTFLSASLVALGFVSGGAPVGGALPLVVIAILSLDLFVGIATLGRMVGTGREEFRALQAINRLRHAYVEMVPSLEPYLTDPPFDDAGSILATYGTSTERPGVLGSIGHGLTTMPGLVAALDAALVGGLVGTVATVLGADERTAVAVGVVVGVAAGGALSIAAHIVFSGVAGSIDARFPAPAPSASPDQPSPDQPSRRNT